LGAFGGLALLPFALLATVRVVRGPRLRERESSEDDDASADDGACADDVAPEDDA
ncbi:MAG: hypothetical protein HY561_03755, partial [Gemmatimonadetes bacterium]|nr:hypothetical protein [Gemmatimonadota bacterium]